MVKASLRRPTTGTNPTPTPNVETMKQAKVTEAAPTDSAVDAALDAVPENIPPGEENQPAPTAPTQSLVRLNEKTSGFEGEFDSSDEKLPQLKLVQGSGKTAQMFDIGTLIYADDILLPPPSKLPNAVNPSLKFVPLLIAKQFREKLSKEAADAGELPRIVNSLQAVTDNGGTTYWPFGSPVPDNYWEDSSRCILLIQRPEGSEHPGFPMEFDGDPNPWAVAVYYAAGGTYKSFTKVIYSVRKTVLLTPVLDAAGKPTVDASNRVIKDTLLYKYPWTSFWRSVLLKNGKAPWYPQIKVLSKTETGPELRAYAETFLRATPIDKVAPVED